ncbi:MAG: hypothetical protein FWC01_03915 [Treponema sp.]|nr:hypothetical protein [Treponema sp.]MCL2237305.1 hypothetical protein [Treponema sp.]
MKYKTVLFFLTCCVLLFAGCTDYYHDLSLHITTGASSDVSISAFSFHPDENPNLDKEYSGNVFYDDGEILIIMPPDFLETIELNLKPRFTVKGLVYVDGSIQTSGENEQLFEDEIVYEVVSANGANRKNYTVKILGKYSRIYVRHDAEEGGDGSSWNSAFASIHDAASLAFLFHESIQKEIWIAAGTYKPGDTDADFFRLIANTRYIGGFAGNETAIGQRNLAVNKTIVSGSVGTGIQSVNLFTTADAAAVNSIMEFNGISFESSRTAISAFLSSSARLTVANCTFKNFQKTAIFSFNGRRTTVTDSVFENIEASDNFGAVHIGTSETEILRVTFKDITGNALSVIGANANIKDAEFLNINGKQALFVDQIAQSGTINISDVLIDTVTYGRGMYISSHSLVLTKTQIKSCDTEDFGGGIHLVNYGYAEISFTEISDTFALTGNGIYYDGSASSALLIRNVKFNNIQITSHGIDGMHLFGNNIDFVWTP